MRISNNNSINFQSGLSSSLINMQKKINVQETEKFFRFNDNKPNGSFRHMDLKNNSAYAVANIKCAEIFAKLKRACKYSKCKTEQFIMPHDLYVYDENELTEEERKEDLFFFTAHVPILSFGKDEHYFQTSDVLMVNKYNSLEEINDITEFNKKNNYLSTGHVLHWFIHEWIHSLQFQIISHNTDNLFKGNYDKTIKHYINNKLSDEDAKIVEEVLGKYSVEGGASYVEVFAEAWTKFICEALDESSSGFKKDPMDIVKSMPKDFLTILKKVSSIDFID